jgi:hypothetical protein
VLARALANACVSITHPCSDSALGTSAFSGPWPPIAVTKARERIRVLPQYVGDPEPGDSALGTSAFSGPWPPIAVTKAREHKRVLPQYVGTLNPATLDGRLASRVGAV